MVCNVWYIRDIKTLKYILDGRVVARAYIYYSKEEDCKQDENDNRDQYVVTCNFNLGHGRTMVVLDILRLHPLHFGTWSCTGDLGFGSGKFVLIQGKCYFYLDQSVGNIKHSPARLLVLRERKGKEMFYLNDALNTFYLRLYGIRHMVKDHSDSERERGNPLLPHGLLFPISSKGYFICAVPQTGQHIPQPLLHQSWSTGSIQQPIAP